MSEHRDSLVEKADHQLKLNGLSDAQLAVVPAMKADGTYTGELFFRTHPEKYRAIIWLTAEGVGIIRISKLVECSPSTVMAVQGREGGQIEIAKQRLGNMARNGAQLCVEGIIEALVDDDRRKKIPPRDLAVIHGILVEKWQLLSGGVTQRIEVNRGAEPTHDDYMALLAALRTGGDAGKLRQKGDGRPVDQVEMSPDEASKVIEVEALEVDHEKQNTDGVSDAIAQEGQQKGIV